MLAFIFIKKPRSRCRRTNIKLPTISNACSLGTINSQPNNTETTDILDNKRLHNLTLVFIGALAYVFADIIHEAIGHGVTCLILGNKITLLTSVYFRSEPHSFITDLFGPILNLIVGLTIWIVLKQSNFTNLYIKLLLILTMAFNCFWFSWMCIYSGITNTDDFALYIPTQTKLFFWRLFLILVGLSAYFLTFKLTLKRTELQSVSPTINVRQLFLIPWLSAGAFAFIAVSFYRPLSIDSYYEAFVFPMFLPTIFLARQLENNNHTDKQYFYGHKKQIIFFGLALLILFCLTIGQGIQP